MAMQDESSWGLAPDNVKSLHDIRASLAILCGFGEALENSFVELSSCVDAAVCQHGLQNERETVGQLKTLEADCRFCLSRIRLSAAQLKEQLEELDVDR